MTEEEREEAKQRSMNLNRLRFETNHPCDECVYWHRLHYTDKENSVGWCRRYPPKPYTEIEQDEAENHADRLPVTFDSDFCGEFKSAKRRTV
jgi:hypothetical protein